jgi:cold shock CspA family protein
MRFEGELEKWNDDRGFGFVASTRGGEPVFVHISAFPRDGRRPKLGETLTFEVEPAGDGKKRAIRIERPGAPPQRRPDAATPGTRSHRPPRGKRSALPIGGIAVGVAIVLFAGHALYDRLNGPRANGTPTANGVVRAVGMAEATPTPFRCDGRTHCSQMTSCAEATFFLKNCPGTKMDGNGDGIPCERQWCN